MYLSSVLKSTCFEDANLPFAISFAPCQFRLFVSLFIFILFYDFVSHNFVSIFVNPFIQNWCSEFNKWLGNERIRTFPVGPNKRIEVRMV